MKISFAWWNTSLSPPRGAPATDGHKEFVIEKINRLINEVGIQVLALGEVAERDIEMIRQRCAVAPYVMISGCKPAGGGPGWFDSCVIFNSETFAAAGDSEEIELLREGRTLRVAQKFTFSFSAENIPIHFFVSHWPSRLRCGQNDPARLRMGEYLRRTINDDVFTKFGDDALVVLLGDYNDEPFDQSLTEHLWSTRDRELVKKKRTLLYNPFWRSLGHASAVDIVTSTSLLDGGTYYYSNDETSRWRTFDQILVSSVFLDSSGWHLNETLTRPLDIDGYSSKLVDRKEKFDHLPVMAVIERNF